MLRTILLSILAISLLWPMGAAIAPPDDPAIAKDNGPTRIEAPGPEATGESAPQAEPPIADRLEKIYELSGWFDEIEVRTQNNIVIIDGQAKTETARDWAGEIASQTDGVEVVINRVQINVPPKIDAFLIREEIAELWKNVYRLLPLIGIGLIVLLLSSLVARYFSRLLAMPIARLTDSELLQNISRRLVGVFIVLAGLIFFLRITGLTAIAITIVSGTGVLGLILGFAFRDIAENFLASILMSIQRPFRVGDVIEVAGNTGVVHKVTSRGTVLVDFDGNHIQIANATVYKSTLKNFTANPKRRLQFAIGIGYDASITLAQNVAMDVLHNHPAILDDPEPLVLVDQLGTSTINLKVYYWIDGNTHSAFKVGSAIMRQVLRAVEKAGISLPDEAREIIFPNGIPVTMTKPDDPASPEPPQDTSSQTGPDTPAGHREEQVDTDLQVHVTDAEGDLSSEVNEIKSQAAESREVEAGKDIISD